jgi:nucleoside-triphosphatase THEP1
MSKPNPWVDALKAMPSIALWEVTPENRDDLVGNVLKWIGGG